MMTTKGVVTRIVELIKEDEELRCAVIEAIDSYTNAQNERADWYRRRNQGK